MRLRFACVLAVFSILSSSLSTGAERGKGVSLWLTTADRSSLLQKQPELLHFRKSSAQLPTIEVNDKQKYQSMDGFGFALTGGSAQLLMHMDAPQRVDLLKEIFGTGDSDIGVSYLRVSIGSSDMNDHAFTYDDLPPGATDAALAKFDLGPDATTVVPVLKEILAINPAIRILGSPWSAPAWMKTNGSLKGGRLKPEYYQVYAEYFAKYIEIMRTQGIRIDAITIQNEPLNPKNTPSMVMEAGEEAAFIKLALGPTFRERSIRTKIILYDHNCDRSDYPLTILNDSDAQQYVDGSGFHLYEGEITALSKVHEAYLKKNLYFTEQMVTDRKEESHLDIATPVQRLIIGAPRNWSRNVLLWNLAADPLDGPHTDNGGCPVCEGAITLSGDAVTRNVAYYTVAHASRFVRPGSVRVDTNSSETLPNVAYKTPNGRHVLIVANTAHAAQTFQILYHGKAITTSLKDGAVATYVW